MAHRTTWIVATMAMAASSALTFAQTPPTQPAPPQPAAESTKKTDAPSAAGTKDGAKEAPKSLDDVLGIPNAGKSGGEGSKTSNDAAPALDKARERVEQALDEKALEDLMRQALGGMRVSADRLANETDYGLGTQRVQQDVIAKLDTLIEDAKKRCKKGQCSSQSSSQCNNPQKDGESKKPGDSKSKSQQAKKPGNAEGANAAGGEPPPVDPTDQNVVFDESRAEWGKLPERVRELIRQGSRDRIASIYQRMTEEYYRRMAEDASK